MHLAIVTGGCFAMIVPATQNNRKPNDISLLDANVSEASEILVFGDGNPFDDR
jgi:hypothetical protein